MNTSKSIRGSDKLFALDHKNHAGLAEAIGIAREHLDIKWWWKKGTPVIDHMQISVEVSGAQLGSAVAAFMQQNANGLQVTASCFPYAIINPERYRLEVVVDKNVAG